MYVCICIYKNTTRQSCRVFQTVLLYFSNIFLVVVFFKHLYAENICLKNISCAHKSLHPDTKSCFVAQTCCLVYTKVLFCLGFRVQGLGFRV